MRIIKKFVRDEVTEFVSHVFDKVILKSDFPIPFSIVEFHIRDSDITFVKDDRAIICIDYNNPLLLEKDERAVSAIVRRELFRISLRTAYPRQIEDIEVGREMIRRGFGDDLFYLYYNTMMKSRPGDTLKEYITFNIPWVTFRGLDNYNSNVLKELAEKRLKKKFPEAKKLLNYMCNDKFPAAVKEYRVLV